MDFQELWKCGEHRVQRTINYAQNIGVQNQQTLRIGLFYLLGFIAIFYAIRWFRRSETSRTWLKLRSNTPDPEKSDDVSRFTNQNMKPTDRKPGSK